MSNSVQNYIRPVPIPLLSGLVTSRSIGRLRESYMLLLSGRKYLTVNFIGQTGICEFWSPIVRLRVHFSRHCNFNQLSD